MGHCAAFALTLDITAAGLPRRRLLEGGARPALHPEHVPESVPEPVPKREPDRPDKGTDLGFPGGLKVKDTDYIWETKALQPFYSGMSREPSTITPFVFQVRQDVEVPGNYEVLHAAILAKGDEPAVAFDTDAGTLSVPAVMLGEPLPDDTRNTRDGPLPPPVPASFSAVEWSIGEQHITTAVQELSLLKSMAKAGQELLLCSTNAELAEAVNVSSSSVAQGRRGRRALMQIALDCGTLSSKSFCICGQPPINWGAGERAVLVAARWTPQFIADKKSALKSQVCAYLGPLLPKVTQSVGSTAPLSAAPVVTGPVQLNVSAIAILGGVVAGIILVIGMIAVYIRTRKDSGGTSSA